MAGTKGMTHYPAQLKLEAIRQLTEEGKTYRQIAEALKIRQPRRIQVWWQQYRRQGVAGLVQPQGRPRQRASVQVELERLRMENALLKKFHTELRTKALAKRNIG